MPLVPQEAVRMVGHRAPIRRASVPRGARPPQRALGSGPVPGVLPRALEAFPNPLTRGVAQYDVASTVFLDFFARPLKESEMAPVPRTQSAHQSVHRECKALPVAQRAIEPFGRQLGCTLATQHGLNSRETIAARGSCAIALSRGTT